MLNFSKYGEQQILGLNLPQKLMNGKYFEKLYIKTIINKEQCALVSNFSKFGEH